MAVPKSKLQITGGKTPKAKLGAMTSGTKQETSPLMPKKKDYKKNQQADFGMPNFGQTGLTGES